MREMRGGNEKREREREREKEREREREREYNSQFSNHSLFFFLN
jgi:hypothetical protein